MVTVLTFLTFTSLPLLPGSLKLLPACSERQQGTDLCAARVVGSRVRRCWQLQRGRCSPSACAATAAPLLPRWAPATLCAVSIFCAVRGRSAGEFESSPADTAIFKLHGSHSWHILFLPSSPGLSVLDPESFCASALCPC